jgi:uncharacterized membrane protein YhhN
MNRRRWATVSLVAYAVVGVLNILTQLLGWEGDLSVADLVLMPILVAYVLLAAPRGRPSTLLVVGLGFSWLGDCTGDFLLLKIAFFLGAQVAYAALFWPYRRRIVQGRPVLVLGYGVAVVALTVFMASRAGSLAVPVTIYGTAVALMAVLATQVSRVVGVGGFLFLLSDIVLGCYFFLGPDLIPSSLGINSLLYYPAQLLIALGVVSGLLGQAGKSTPTLAAARG